MNRFELPTELDELQTRELRLNAIIGTNDNWDDLSERGWRVAATPTELEYVYNSLFPNLTYDSNKEASRRAATEGVFMPIPEDGARDCGRVALAHLKDVDMWHAWGYGKSSKPRLVVITNPEIFGDSDFIQKIPEAEAQLRKVGRLILGESQRGRYIPYSFPENPYMELLKTTGHFLGHMRNDINLVADANAIFEQTQERETSVTEAVNETETDPGRRSPWKVVKDMFEALDKPQPFIR